MHYCLGLEAVRPSVPLPVLVAMRMWSQACFASSAWMVDCALAREGARQNAQTAAADKVLTQGRRCHGRWPLVDVKAPALQL